MIIFGQFPTGVICTPSNSIEQSQFGVGYGTLLQLENSRGTGVCPDGIQADDYWGEYGWSYLTWE